MDQMTENEQKSSQEPPEKKKKEKKGVNTSIVIIITAMIAGLLVVSEIYLIVSFSDFVQMLAVAIAFVIDLGILINAVLSRSSRENQEAAEKYEDIYNAQKASYLVLRRSFESLQQQMDDLVDNEKIPAEEIINAQKAVAKVTISRSKENTEALMNSNFDLMKQIQSFEGRLDEQSDDLIQRIGDVVDDAKNEIFLKNNELEKQINDLSHAINLMQNTINSIEQTQRLMQQSPVMMAVQAMQQPGVAQAMPGYVMPQTVQNTMTAAVQPAQQIPPESLPSSPEPVPPEEVVSQSGSKAVPPEETAAAQPAAEIPPEEEVPSASIIVKNDPNRHMTEEEIEKMVAEQEARASSSAKPQVSAEEPAAAVPDVPEKEPVLEEPEATEEETFSTEPEISVDDALSEEPEVSLDEAFSEEPEISLEDEFPETSENQPSPEPSPAPAPEPSPAPASEPAAEAAQEPVKVTPISDDPNKQLSPEEIAALFASVK